MKNIFVNLESGDGVMIFTENEQITPEVVEKGLRKRGMAIIILGMNLFLIICLNSFSNKYFSIDVSV